MGFGSLMDIDKLIRKGTPRLARHGFGSLMDIDKLIHSYHRRYVLRGFGSLMDIDKLILVLDFLPQMWVLVL